MSEIVRSNKLMVYASNFARRKSACQYYRIMVPVVGLERLNLCDGFVDEGTSEKDMSVALMLSSEIDLMWGVSGDNNYDTVRTIKDMKSAKGPDGSMLYPPSVVYDIDDNLEYTHPFNIAFGQLGVRNVDGSLLEPGDDIWTQLADGTPIPVWEDCITRDIDGAVFNIAKNRLLINSTHSIAKAADGVTVPTKPLADYFRNVIGVRNVHVFPNSIIEDHYMWPNLVPRNDGSVRILWQGGDSHMQDWFYLKDALKEICQKYPQVKFVMWGSKYDWIYEAIPEHQLEYHGWTPYEGYKYKRVLLDIDINLCPLAPNVFNKCKSAIKWYESSLGSKPAATLASNFGPYKEIQDGVTGLLYDTPEEFVQKLSTLIENADLRTRLGDMAHKWVLENRSIQATIPDLAEFYLDLRQQRKREADVHIEV